MSEQSGNFNDVLGKPPIRSWKWSIFLVLVMIALIGAVTWWLDYRNAVEVELRIFTKDKSLEFFADQAGQIEKKWLQNGAVVKKNQPVFSFKTSANFEDVIKLKDALQKDANTTLPKGSYGVLSVEADEVQKLQNQLAILKGSGVERQAFFLKQSADSLRHALENIDTQIALIREEIQIAKDNFREYQLLHETGAASRLEVNSAKTQWIHYQKELEVKLDEKKQLNARILLQSGESNQLLSTKKEQISLLEATISAKKSQLYHQIELWQKEHLILAPKDGVLYFNQNYQIGDFVQKGQMIARVLPEGQTIFQAEGFMKAGRSGEVEVGDKVFLRVDAFPYRKYGQLEGRVSAIGKVFIQTQDIIGVSIIVSLDNGLKTTQNKELSYQDGMPALGRIIVD